MIKVINGEIKQIGLPKTGTLSDGRTVSNYHMLSPEILKSEGWLPLEDNPVEYNPDIEYFVVSYTILPDKVVKNYKVERIPETVYDVGLKALIKTIRIDTLTADDLIEIMPIYPEWETLLSPEPQKAELNKLYRYNGNLYKVRQEHMVQADYTPDITPALYWIYYPEGVIPKYIVGRPYNTGDKIIFQDKVYVSLQDNNVWSPLEYPRYWKEDLPEGTVPDYVEGTWYQLGDRMRFTDSLVYESIYQGNNVWNPTTYPRGWKLIP